MAYNPFSLSGKTVLVTGASSGIGRGIAVACSKMGALVIVVGRNQVRLQETLRQMEGEQHIMQICDLTNTDALSIFVDKLPKLDGVVHCAGIGQRLLAKQLTSKDVDKVMDINFKAQVLLQAELLSHKKINKGASIVFIASFNDTLTLFIADSKSASIPSA